MSRAKVEAITVETHESVATLTLNRPEKRNALNWAMWRELLTTLRDLSERTDIRIVIVTGAAGAFCSGADLADPLPDIHPYLQLEQINAVMEALHHIPKITVARVNGDAIGAGANLALVCDITIASVSSRFAEIFVRRGMSIDCGGSWILPRLIGLHKAMEVCLTGSMISATQAASLGLINLCTEDDELDGAVSDLVGTLLEGAPIAQLLTKRLLQDGALSTFSQALDREAQAQVMNVGGRDLTEARIAFAERRPAVFTGEWGAVEQ